MKKLISILLAATMMLSVCACGDDDITESTTMLLEVTLNTPSETLIRSSVFVRLPPTVSVLSSHDVRNPIMQNVIYRIFFIK